MNSASFANSASTFECGGENLKILWQSWQTWQSTGAMMTQIDEIRQSISLIALGRRSGRRIQ